MKTKKNFQNGVLAMSAFMFTASVVMALYTLLSFDEFSRKHYQQVMAAGYGKDVIQVTPTEGVASTEKQVLDLSKEIAKLKQEKAKLDGNLEKARSERNKNYGMVAGLSYQPSQGLNEVVTLEGKIKNVDHQLTALNNKKMSLNHQLAQNKKVIAGEPLPYTAWLGLDW